MPVIPAQTKFLDAYKLEYAPDRSGSFSAANGEASRSTSTIFRAATHDRTAVRVHVIGLAFVRGGIGTRLFYLGADAKTVQSILRHSAVSTTMAHWVIPDQKEMNAAMEKFDDFLAALESKRKVARAHSSIG